jgi:pyridoxamine 5'-phosphate oxidase
MSSGNLRREYTRGGLTESAVDADPIRQFSLWFKQAIDAECHEPTAMTLATSTRDGQPSARIVLLKQFDERGFVFYTNYESDKARELEANPRAGMVFWWPPLERQVRITGVVSKTSEAESEAYFRTRPAGSRLGAWASPQSRVIASREELERRLVDAQEQYPGDAIPLPPFWGGYRVTPDSIEFWQGRENRLHDRLRYTRQANGSWKIARLAP